MNREKLAALPMFNLTDQGNAKAFALLYSDEIRFCPERNRWLRWDGTVWQSDQDSKARQLFIRSLQHRAASVKIDDGQAGTKVKKFLVQSENNRAVLAAMASATHLEELIVKESQLDADTMRLVLANGELDLRTLEFRDPDPISLCTFQSPVRFDPEAGCPMWLKVIEEVFGGDEELIEFFQKCVGYSLTGNVSEQVMFVCVGEGSNGKSTILEVVKALLGSYAGTAPFATFDAKTRSDQTNDLARLKGKRFVSIVETDEDSYLAEAKIKHATGDEAITCRFFYKEFFEYVPQFKIWLATNRAPSVKGADYGIQRRILILPFNRQFRGDEVILGLKEKLMMELPGILNWALEGTRRWQEEGLKVDLPECVRIVKEEYTEDNDMIAKWLWERTEKGEETDFVRANEFYMDYANFMRQSGLRPKGRPQWGRDMKSKGVVKNRDSKGERYMAIRLSEEVIT